MADKKISELPSILGTNLADNDRFVVVDTDATETKAVDFSELKSATVASIVDSAPATLDTLNELADALGDDPNFATTVTASIATKVPLAGGVMTGDLSTSGEMTANIMNAGDMNITGPSPQLIMTDDDVADEWTKFYNVSGTTYLDMRNGAANGVLRIRGLGGGSVSDFVRVNNTGKVGIGTITPTSKLDVVGTIRGEDLTLTGGTEEWDVVADGTNLTFKYNGVNTMRLTSTGDLSVIGSVTPNATIT